LFKSYKGAKPQSIFQIKDIIYVDFSGNYQQKWKISIQSKILRFLIFAEKNADTELMKNDVLFRNS